MFKLTEDSTSDRMVNVHYMSPEDLRNVQPDLQLPTDRVEKEPEWREVFHDNDENPTSPLDAINRAKADPSNVTVFKYNDDNYVTHSDLDTYMKASDIKNYDDAISNVAYSNDSLGDNDIKIIMSKSEFDECSGADRARLEAATVQVVIYDK